MADAMPVVPGGVPSASLYVGDVDRNVSHDFFYNLFNSVAPVVSCKICKDWTRRQSSLCFAFVDFRNIQDATEALKRLFFTKINGKPIRIMFSPYSFQRNANVYVHNLDSSIDNEKLYKFFSIFGTIVSCKVATDDNGNSKGHGYVQFEKERYAQTAMESLNGVPIDGKPVYVEPFKGREERTQGNGSSKFTNVCVKNLPEATTVEDLENLFSPLGPIDRVVVKKDKHENPRSYGFVNFKSTDAAASAVSFNKRTFGGRTLYVERAKTKAELRVGTGPEMMGQPAATADLCVKIFNESVHEETLKAFFSNLGTVTSWKRQFAQYQASIAIPHLHCGTSGLMRPPPAALGFPQHPPVAASDNLWVQGQFPLTVDTRLPYTSHNPEIRHMLYPHGVHPAHSHQAEDILDDAGYGLLGSSSSS